MDGNEMADKLAKRGFSHPLIGPVPAVKVSAEFAKGVIRAGRAVSAVSAVSAVRLWTSAG